MSPATAAACSQVAANVLMLLGLACIGASLYGLQQRAGSIEESSCQMTYMRPSYHLMQGVLDSHQDASVPRLGPSDLRRLRNYNLYLYREGGATERQLRDVEFLRGLPVLYVPGHRGSYRQVRSLASALARQTPPLFSVYTVDFREEMFDPILLERQALYVVQCLHYLRGLHRARAAAHGPVPKVVLFGHSLGGVVAHMALVHPKRAVQAVDTVLTLAAPHAAHPVPLSPKLRRLYLELQNGWRDKLTQQEREGLVLVHVSGGIRDLQVRVANTLQYGRLRSTTETPLNNGSQPPYVIDATTMSMPHVYTSADHQAILWCNQLILQTAEALRQIVTPQDTATTATSVHDYLSAKQRHQILQMAFQSHLPVALGVLPTAHSPGRTVRHSVHTCRNPPPHLSFATVIGAAGDRGADVHRGESVGVLYTMDGIADQELRVLTVFDGATFELMTRGSTCCHVTGWTKDGDSTDLGHLLAELSEKQVNSKRNSQGHLVPGRAYPVASVLKLRFQEIKQFMYISVQISQLETHSRRSQTLTITHMHATIPRVATGFAAAKHLLHPGHALISQVGLDASPGYLPFQIRPELIDAESSSLCFTPEYILWGGDQLLMDVGYLELGTWNTMQVDPPAWTAKLGANGQRGPGAFLLLVSHPWCAYQLQFRPLYFRAAANMAMQNAPQVLPLVITTLLLGMRVAVEWQQLGRSRCTTPPASMTELRSFLNPTVVLGSVILPSFLVLYMMQSSFVRSRLIQLSLATIQWPSSEVTLPPFATSAAALVGASLVGIGFQMTSMLVYTCCGMCESITTQRRLMTWAAAGSIAANIWHPGISSMLLLASHILAASAYKRSAVSPDQRLAYLKLRMSLNFSLWMTLFTLPSLLAMISAANFEYMASTWDDALWTSINGGTFFVTRCIRHDGHARRPAPCPGIALLGALLATSVLLASCLVHATFMVMPVNAIAYVFLDVLPIVGRDLIHRSARRKVQ